MLDSPWLISLQEHPSCHTCPYCLLPGSTEPAATEALYSQPHCVMVRLLGPGHREELRCRGLCGKNIQSGLLGVGADPRRQGTWEVKFRAF